jgi:hypothetical protein
LLKRSAGSHDFRLLWGPASRNSTVSAQAERIPESLRWCPASAGRDLAYPAGAQFSDHPPRERSTVKTGSLQISLRCPIRARPSRPMKSFDLGQAKALIRTQAERRSTLGSQEEDHACSTRPVAYSSRWSTKPSLRSGGSNDQVDYDCRTCPVGRHPGACSDACADCSAGQPDHPGRGRLRCGENASGRRVRGKDNSPSRPPRGPQVPAVERRSLRSLRVIIRGIARTRQLTARWASHAIAC